MVPKCHRQQATEQAEVDVVLLSNGPGEVAAWVKPVVASLRTKFGGRKPSFRISVILTPCPHASGRELELIRSYSDVDRCQGPESFWNLLLFGSTEDGWTWHRKGVVVFLGGDQLYTVILSRRLGYKSIVYSEESVLWPGLVDRYMLRSAHVLSRVPLWAQSRCKVVGDLFSDSVVWRPIRLSSSWQLGRVYMNLSSVYANVYMCIQIINLSVFPLLQASKLALGVPYFMAVANHLHHLMMGRVRFVLPLAPTVTLSMLAKQADPLSNPNISQFHWSSAKVSPNVDKQLHLEHQDESSSGGTYSQFEAVGHLMTDEGVHIDILQQFPAHDVFKRCSLCVTTIGTNTAELGYLGIPMLVVLPTHALEVFRGGTGGALGLLANMPGELGKYVAQEVNSALLKSSGYIAWPNRWVDKEVVPELVGRIEPVEIANVAAHYLFSQSKLEAMKRQLLKIHSRPDENCNLESRVGASEAIATEVLRLMSLTSSA
ncbi:hypothetical protein MPTK1_4g15230 [Marchantia polymorpha subsp. ruderalis]|uniref:Lipid-A-disaccharide synthase n=2 Tax=Marchantia polymorpha TaxID=3197 RepID=A0AAF6BA49_MARPO|nr:hypothetical protein MARPO_0119s0047 [Marchantia polymorpha]BBN08883.1 hypothetical protein Mp_4g15230 [Marchantia polymorpha subsp. ruderalis]|eukprot:PTQ30849.1 hypothetical protein MARPO_0119s0047 [Marchantia polymorpha]